MLLVVDAVVVRIGKDGVADVLIHHHLTVLGAGDHTLADLGQQCIQINVARGAKLCQLIHVIDTVAVGVHGAAGIGLGIQTDGEYQLNAILKKYDLRDDDQKVKYLQESAELICTLSSSVQREVYSGRVAETAKISMEAMKMEVGRAFKRRIAREKKKQEKIDLAPAKNRQPQVGKMYYKNVKSAMAEEMVLALCLRESALLDHTVGLEPEMFSSELLGRVFSQLSSRHKQGLEVSLSGLTDFTPEEMSHIAGILQRQQGPVNEQALLDCIHAIQDENQSAKVTTDDDLLARRERMKQRKGIKA